jgi:hypothetical protein
VTYALLTKTSISLHSSGNPLTKPLTALGSLTSSLAGKTFTPSPTSAAMSFFTCSTTSTRLAASTRRRSLGAVRANSRAVLRPIPDDAPVIRMVLPSSRLATEAIV